MIHHFNALTTLFVSLYVLSFVNPGATRFWSQGETTCQRNFSLPNYHSFFFWRGTQVNFMPANLKPFQAPTQYIYTFSLQLQFAPYSQNHCSGSAMECSSFEAICNESEMIAHLQSLFWSSSDADPCFGSSSFSLISSEGYDTMTTEFVNSSTNVCFDYQDDSFVSAEDTTIGNKRKVQMDTENELMMNHSKEVRTKMSVRAYVWWSTIVLYIFFVMEFVELQVSLDLQVSKACKHSVSAESSQSYYAKVY